MGQREAIISLSTFSQNYAEVSGGALAAYFCSPSVQSSVFNSNSATESGGAIVVRDSGAISLSYTNFTGNSADNVSD